MARQSRAKKTKPRAKALRRRGFMVKHAFVPYRFSQRITPPYYETDDQDLADTLVKCKGCTELSASEMEDYKAALRVLDPKRLLSEIQQAKSQDEAAKLEAEEAAKAEAALAATKAAAAKERSDAAAAKVAELGGDDADLFEEEEAAAADGPEHTLTDEDLAGMDQEGLLGVLELYGIDPPKKQGTEILMAIARQAIAGKLKAEAPAE